MPIGNNQKVLLAIILSASLFLIAREIVQKRSLPGESKKPNIVFISLDALRADHLGCYGYPRATSPHIDSLAARGTRFTQAITQYPSTSGSISAILTSLYPSHELIETTYALSSKNTNLPRILKAHGYTTALFTANKVNFETALKHIRNDFDLFYAGDDTSESIMANVSAWLTNNKNEPFFIWIHLFDPHGPYNPPEPYDKEFLTDNLYPDQSAPIAPDDGNKNKYYSFRYIPRYVAEDGITDTKIYIAKYDGAIKYADEQIKKLLDRLKTLGLENNTLLVLFSDHGESMTEHNFYFNHSHYLYEGLIRVPLLFVFPNEIPKNKSVTEQAQLIDILPTVLDAAKIKNAGFFEGKSLLPLMRGEDNRGDQYAFSESAYFPSPQCVRTKDWKLIFSRKKNKYELYDLRNDGKELHNKIEEDPEIALRLKQRLHDWLLYAKTHLIEKEDNISEPDQEKLRSLGYAQ